MNRIRPLWLFACTLGLVTSIFQLGGCNGTDYDAKKAAAVQQASLLDQSAAAAKKQASDQETQAAAAQKTIDALNARIAELEDTGKSLADQVDQLTKKLAAADLGEADRAATQALLDDIGKQLAAVTASVGEAKHKASTQIADLNAQITTAQASAASLKQSAAQASLQAGQIRDRISQADAYLADPANTSAADSARGGQIGGLIGGLIPGGNVIGTLLGSTVGGLAWQLYRKSKANGILQGKVDYLADGVTAIVKSIDVVKDTDPTVAAAFEKAAPVIKAIQGAAGNSLVDLAQNKQVPGAPDGADELIRQAA